MDVAVVRVTCKRQTIANSWKRNKGAEFCI